MQTIERCGVGLHDITALHRLMRLSQFPGTPDRLEDALADLVQGQWWFIKHNGDTVAFFGLDNISRGYSAGFNIGCLESFRSRWARGTVEQMIYTCFAEPRNLKRLYMQTDLDSVGDLALRLGFVLSYTDDNGTKFYTLEKNQNLTRRH